MCDEHTEELAKLRAVAEAADTLWIYIDHHQHDIEGATQHFFWADHQELGKALTDAGYAYANVGKIE